MKKLLNYQWLIKIKIISIFYKINIDKVDNYFFYIIFLIKLKNKTLKMSDTVSNEVVEQTNHQKTNNVQKSKKTYFPA